MPRSPRFTVSVAEMLVVAAIVSTICAILLPAVNDARDAQQLLPVIPGLRPLYQHNPWPFIIATPIVVTACLAAFIAVVRYFVPATVRRYFRWRAPKMPLLPPPPPIADSRPAIVTLVMAFIATAILILVASHVRADRTNRRPIVTWVGPLADYVQHAAVCGWLLSAAAIALGAYTLTRFRSRLNFLAVIGMGLGCTNYCGSCLFYGIVYED